MKKHLTPILAALLAAALIVPGAALAATGPEVFQALDCSSCHAVKVANIPVKPGAGDDEASDLSKAGAKRDKVWIAKWLLKKEELDGEKHKKKFRGTVDELKIVAEWLAGLK